MESENVRKINELKTKMVLWDYHTTITREDFEATFERTKDHVTFTFNGWDGESYDGESRTSRVYRCKLAGYESLRFIKVGKCLHWVSEELALEKATGEYHNKVYWFVVVARKGQVLKPGK